jgi:hypothetical protein
VTLDKKHLALRPPQTWAAFYARAVGATPNSLGATEFPFPLPAQPEQSEILIMEATVGLRYHAGVEPENSAHANRLIRVISGSFRRIFT